MTSADTLASNSTLYRLTLKMPAIPESLNKKLRSHRMKNDRENKSWDLYIASQVQGKRPRAPLKRARLCLVRHSYRMLDFDGVVGSLKPIVDALVTCGILSQDTWDVTGPWHVDQKFRPKAQGPLLEISVSELPDS